MANGHLKLIDHVQVLVLSIPTKFAGWLVVASLFAIAIDPLIGAVGLAALSAGLAWLSALYWFQRNQAIKERDRIAGEHIKLVERVEQIELQSHVLAQAMLPVSAAFQAILVKELTHMHTPEMDSLMVKLGPPFMLTETEAERLAALLEQRTRDMDAEITPSERDAARMMPALMRRVREETAEQAKPTPTLMSLTAIVQGQDGVKKAMIIQTIPTVQPSEREVLSATIAENTRVTREANEAARALLNKR